MNDYLMGRRTASLFDAINTGNPVSDRKIQLAIADLPRHTQRQLLNEFSAENRLLLVEFLNNFQANENISAGTLGRGK